MKLKALIILIVVPTFLVGQNKNYPFQNESLNPEERAEDLVSRMTLQEKVAQMQDVAPAIDRLGIPEYNWWNECLHGVARAGAATSFPQAIGMAATWNEELIYKVADVISTEARAKHNKSIGLNQRNRYQGLTMWTPNINIFRDPRWGRGQETYGEDPFLTARLGVAFVKGLQGDDPDYFKVIATPKHYAVHSGPEYNRHSFDAYTDQRDLWETYLPAFKATIIEGQAFSIMSAYNRYLGESATASSLLLDDILRKQWGFQGYVVSDCGAVSDIYRFHKIVDSPEEAAALSVKAGCDLNCGTTFSALENAVKKGLITEEEIDISLKRLFLARIKLGLLNSGKIPFDDIGNEDLESESHQKIALQTARESIVLLKNENELLPLSKSIKKILVVGPNANDKHFALGNYFGTPSHLTTVLEGIQSVVSNKTEVVYYKGTNLINADTIFDVLDEESYKGEILAEYYDNSNLEGNPVASRKIKTIDYEWGGSAPLDILKPGKFSIRFTGTIRPKFTGVVNLGVMESGGSFELSVDGNKLTTGKGGNGTQALSEAVRFEKGKTYRIQLDYQCTNPWLASIQLVWNEEDLRGRKKLLEEAQESEAIVFVGGISARLEGEEMPVEIDGFHKGDRTHMKIPKPQAALLQELHNTGKPVIFILTTGSAMAINWEQNHLPAILNVWYPGQAGGQAVADVLFGDYNPSGRLPLTFYKTIEDLPPFEDYHMKGRTYRYFSGDVLYPFGYGLSYTKFEFGQPKLSESKIGKNDGVNVSIKIRNLGDLAGETVVQVYIRDVESSVTKPIKSLRKFKKIHLDGGETKAIDFELNASDFSITADDGNFFVEPGEFEVFVGDSSSTNNKVLLRIE